MRATLCAKCKRIVLLSALVAALCLTLLMKMRSLDTAASLVGVCTMDCIRAAEADIAVGRKRRGRGLGHREGSSSRRASERGARQRSFIPIARSPHHTTSRTLL